MSVYMEPLIDDLLRAWEEGVWTYDRATKRNFMMYVWYHYSLHDLPAYGIFCGWCVHGNFRMCVHDAGDEVHNVKDLELLE